MWKIQASESVAKQGRGGWIEKPDVELQGKLAAGSYCWICCWKAHNRQDLPQQRMPVMSLRSGGLRSQQALEILRAVNLFHKVGLRFQKCRNWEVLKRKPVWNKTAEKAREFSNAPYWPSSAWHYTSQKLHQLRRHIRRVHPQAALAVRHPAQWVEAAVPNEPLVEYTKVGQAVGAKHNRDARPPQSGCAGGDFGLNVWPELRGLRQVNLHIPALVLQAL